MDEIKKRAYRKVDFDELQDELKTMLDLREMAQRRALKDPAQGIAVDMYDDIIAKLKKEIYQLYEEN